VQGRLALYHTTKTGNIKNVQTLTLTLTLTN